MLGDGGLARADLGFNLRHGTFAINETAQDLEPVLVGQQLQKLAQLLLNGSLDSVLTLLQLETQYRTGLDTLS